MEKNDKIHPKFNNWEYDTMNGNRKFLIYVLIAVLSIISIMTLSVSRNLLMFLFSFTLLLIIWLPIIYLLILPRVKGRILEIKDNGLVVYNIKNEIIQFQSWDMLVDMGSKRYRYGNVTILVFSDGTKIKFYEERWIIEAISEKCKNVSAEEYYENNRQNEQLYLILVIISIVIGLLYSMSR